MQEEISHQVLAQQITAELQDCNKFPGVKDCNIKPLLRFPSYFVAANALLQMSANCCTTKQLSVAYFALSRCLKGNEQTMLPDGRKVGKRDLLLLSIQHDPANAKPYNNLALTLTGNEERTTLHDGAKLNRQELFLKSVELDPLCSDTYCNLASALRIDAEVTLKDGAVMNAHKLFLRAIEVDKSNAFAYECLAKRISPWDRVVLHDGTTLTQIDLLARAIELDITSVDLYISLGISLTMVGGDVTAHDGTKMTARSAYFRAMELDPLCACTYIYLGDTFLSADPSEVLQLPDGSHVTQRDCYMLACSIEPSHPRARECVEKTLCDFQQLLLPCGTRCRKKGV